MSEMKTIKQTTAHTPGPWIVTEGLNTASVKAMVGKLEVYVAEVSLRSWGAMDSRTGRENARLIAASPGLLLIAQAHDAKDALSHDDFVKRFGFSQEHLADKTREVITKSTATNRNSTEGNG
jgi:hypothetical protein